MALHVAVVPELTVADEPFDVVRYTLTEALDAPSRLQARCVNHRSTETAPDAAKLVGKDAQFRLARSDGSSERFFYGFVAEAAHVTDEQDLEFVDLTIVPKLFRLTKRADCRIFQDLAVPAIAEQVLTDAGVPKDQQSALLSASYEPRRYTVQYRETDLDFLLRLLADEGIWLAVHMKDGKDTVVLADDPTGVGEIEGTSTLMFDPGFGFEGSSDHVMRITTHHRVASDKVELREYDYEKPKVQLKANAEGSDEGEHSLEVYEWPGRFSEPGAGKRYAEALCDSLQAERELVTGHTGVITMRPGERFTIEEHPYAPINQVHIVTSVTIEGELPRFARTPEDERKVAFRASFTAIPKAKCKLRPRRRARACPLPGLQTAMTTGPSGEEIHVSAHGEVRAQFHWDRKGKNDQNSATWMRTSQLGLGGSMLLPRMGWEVTVCCREGDVDRPYVMGRLYNGEKRAPYDLPKEKGSSSIQTATTPGGGSANEVKMGDSKGSESMLFNASYDMNVDVKNNMTSSVGANLKKKVGSNQKINVTDSVTSSIGADQNLSVSGNQSIVVQTYMTQNVAGTHSLTVGGNRNMMIGGDHKREVAANSTLTVGGNHYDLTVGDITDNTLANFNHTVGSALMEITSASRSIVVGAMNTENTGAAKIIGTYGGRGVSVNGALSQNVGGALIFSVKGDKSDEAGASFTEVAAGAQFVKAANIVYEAEAMLTLVMGASILVLMPGMIMVTAVSTKLDGKVVGKLLTIDN